MWRQELGVTTRLLNMENTSVLAARRSGDYQIVRSSWTGDYIDPQNFLEIWTSGGGNNFTGWASKDYDRLLETAAGTIDAAKRRALLQSAERLLLREAPCIPIYHFAHIYLRDPAVQGWHSTLLDHHPYKYVWLKD
jgi:oligopeptide transport system substrate-binding protein